MNQEGNDMEVIQSALEEKSHEIFAIQFNFVEFGLGRIRDSKEGSFNDGGNEFKR